MAGERYPLYTGEEGRFRLLMGNVLIGTALLFFVLGLFVVPFISVFFLPLMLLGYSLRRSGLRLLKGYEGEALVSNILLDAPNIDGYLISDVVLPEGKENIDHVLVSSVGVFAIEVKNYDSDVIVDGDEWWLMSPFGQKRIASISRTIKRRAFHLSRFIEQAIGKKIFVQPLVVFTGSGVVVGKSTVPVLRPEELAGYFSSKKGTLSKEEISLIASLLQELGHITMEVSL